MICRKCGAKIEKGSFFCDECGQSIGTVGEIAQMAADDKKKCRKKRSAILTVAAILAVAAYIVGNKYMNSETVNLPSRTDMALTEVTDKPVVTEKSEVTDKPAVTQKPKITQEPEVTEKPSVTAKPEAEESAAESDYMYPSDTTEFTEEFLNSLSRSEARLVRNEFYARYGFVFKSGELKKHFEGKEWYKPNAKLTTVQIHNMFNATERKNYQRIVQFEKSKGWIRK